MTADFVDDKDIDFERKNLAMKGHLLTYKLFFLQKRLNVILQEPIAAKSVRDISGFAT